MSGKRKRVKYVPSIYHAGLSYLVEMDRRLAGRGLVLSDFARDCEIANSTAGRYLAVIVDRIGLAVTCRLESSGKVISAVEAEEFKGRGRRVYRYDEGEGGLFTKQARKAVRANFTH